MFDLKEFKLEHGLNSLYRLVKLYVHIWLKVEIPSNESQLVQLLQLHNKAFRLFLV